jgi:uncharacterized protein YndB with AHSA1/START domain
MSSGAGGQKLDLVLERVVDVPKRLVWAAWTTPEHLKKWFCPAPYRTVECEISLRPGGIFRTLIESPQGEKYPHVGCYLQVEPEELLSWTSALLPGYRPNVAKSHVPAFTATITLAKVSAGTRYTATVMHGSEEDCRAHDEAGFTAGWSAALDQLVAWAKTME